VSEELLTELLTQGVRSALDEGRSSSVRRWIDFGRLHRISNPSVSLAEAELALRDGLYSQSEMRALEVGQCAVSHPGVKPWALLVAGRSAHLAGREREALGYYREARMHAQTDFERREAQWGELKSAIDLEIPEAIDLLRRVKSEGPDNAADQIELASLSLMLGARLGSLTALDEAQAARNVVPLVSDAVARTSFANTYAYACALAGEYAETERVLDELDADREISHVAFALPYFDCARAVALVATGRFDDAFQVLAGAADEGKRIGDAHVTGMCAAIKARALISLQRPREASMAASYTHASLIRSMSGELTMTRALASVCLGRYAEAAELASKARATSNAVEVAGIGACVDAIIGLRTGDPRAADLAIAALKFAVEARYVDGLICSYRAEPELARAICEDAEAASRMVELMSRVGDARLVAALGIRGDGTTESLTPREVEVFELLRHGRSNKEIASALFISDETAKVHVHRILRKLKVRNRTEAATQFYLRESGDSA
jgi:ATP/maltotriose-dependent transcriptional regulator MalT